MAAESLYSYVSSNIVNSISLPFISPNPAILYQPEKQNKTAFQVECFKRQTRAE
jgi:hypothetical protein